ncbi:MAG: hypothetical protein HUJ74_00520 [Lachnospiraceae bacterium]|nr:hypothetical protein [Lachnospiraceae bacterium]
MFRLWGKVMCNNHIMKDMIVCEESKDTRTHKIFRALENICYTWNLEKPIWLNATIQEFQRHKKARFYQDNFIESIDFDFLEIQVIEE